MKPLYKALLVTLTIAILRMVYNQFQVDRIQQDIDQSTKVIDSRSKTIQKATIEKERAEKLLKLSQDYKKRLSELGDVQTPPTVSEPTAEWQSQQLQAPTDTTKDEARTPWYAKCIVGDVITIKDVFYEDYALVVDWEKFAGYKWFYTNSQEDCLIFKDIEDMINQLGTE